MLKNNKPKNDKGPKKPLTAFMFFMNEQRPLVKATNADITFGDIAKKVGAMWAELPVNEKEIYLAKAVADKMRFESEKINSEK